MQRIVAGFHVPHQRPAFQAHTSLLEMISTVGITGVAVSESALRIASPIKGERLQMTATAPTFSAS
jgi:hypothetical protein